MALARRPSPCTPTLLGTEIVLRCCVCCVIDFCLYAAVFRMERCADLVSVFFDTYGGTLCRSAPCILRYLWWYAGPIPFLYPSILIGIFCTSLTFQDRPPSPLPSPACFFPVGWKCQPEEGGIGPGCCGGGVITTWAVGDGVIAAGPAVWAGGEFWPCRNAFSRLTEP